MMKSTNCYKICPLVRIGPNSKVAQHANEFNHNMDFDQATIADRVTDYHKRLFLEAWHSPRDQNAGHLQIASATFKVSRSDRALSPCHACSVGHCMNKKFVNTTLYSQNMFPDVSAMLPSSGGQNYFTVKMSVHNSRIQIKARARARAFI